MDEMLIDWNRIHPNFDFYVKYGINALYTPCEKCSHILAAHDHKGICNSMYCDCKEFSSISFHEMIEGLCGDEVSD